MKNIGVENENTFSSHFIFFLLAILCCAKCERFGWFWLCIIHHHNVVHIYMFGNGRYFYALNNCNRMAVGYVWWLNNRSIYTPKHRQFLHVSARGRASTSIIHPEAICETTKISVLYGVLLSASLTATAFFFFNRFQCKWTHHTNGWILFFYW